MNSLMLRLFIAAIFLVVCNSAHADPPPCASGDIRTPAEWEPVKTVLVRWSFGSFNEVYKSIVDEIQKAGASVLICVSGNEEKDAVISYINDIDHSNVFFWIPEPDENSGSLYTRDWGGQSIFYKDDNQLRAAMVDWRRPDGQGSSGEDIPQKIAQLLAVPFFQHPAFKADGGNVNFDGFGKVLFDNRMYEDNQPGGSGFCHTAMNEYLGCTEPVAIESMAYLLGGGAPHIDLFMKFLDEETILYSVPFIDENDPLRKPMQIEKYNQIMNRIRTVMATFRTPYGRPYQFVKTVGYMSFNLMYTYTNALFVNNTFLMPTYRTAPPEINTAAYETLSSHLPGYNIVQVESNDLMDEGKGSGIHCHTHEYTKDKVVRIGHPRFMAPFQADEWVSIDISTWSTDPIDRARIFVKKPDDDTYFPYNMSQVNPTSYSYQMTSDKTGVYRYYIEVRTTNGDFGYKPPNGPHGGFYTLTYANDFLQIRGGPVNQRHVLWNTDGTTYVPCSTISTSSDPYNHQFMFKNTVRNGFGWSCRGNEPPSFGISGTQFSELEEEWLRNNSLSGGLVIKKNGVPVFYTSSTGEAKFANRVFTNMNDHF